MPSKYCVVVSHCVVGLALWAPLSHDAVPCVSLRGGATGLLKELDEFDWANFLHQLFEDAAPETVIVSSPAYLRGLNTVLKEMKETDPGVLKMYMRWRLAAEFSR